MKQLTGTDKHVWVAKSRKKSRLAMNDLVTVTELRRSFNSPNRDAVRGNLQPQKCTNGSSQNLYYSEGIIESVRREQVGFF